MGKVDVGSLRRNLATMKGKKAEVSKAWLLVVCDELDELERLREKAKTQLPPSIFEQVFGKGKF